MNFLKTTKVFSSPPGLATLTCSVGSDPLGMPRVSQALRRVSGSAGEACKGLTREGGGGQACFWRSRS